MHIKYFVILIVTITLVSGCAKEAKDEIVEISDSFFSIGAVDSGQNRVDRQKLTYDIAIKNPQNISVVDSVEIILSKIMKDKVIEMKRQSIRYDEGAINLSGEVIFDTRGLTKQEIENFAPLIKGVQFIGDDQREYFLPLTH